MIRLQKRLFQVGAEALLDRSASNGRCSDPGVGGKTDVRNEWIQIWERRRRCSLWQRVVDHDRLPL